MATLEAEAPGAVNLCSVIASRQNQASLRAGLDWRPRAGIKFRAIR
jgi:hypothetical protein